MKRTQLYLDDDLWNALHVKAVLSGSSVSELVRTAARDRYMNDPELRRLDMMAAVGLWKERTDLPDTEIYVRKLRSGTRLKRLGVV